MTDKILTARQAEVLAFINRFRATEQCNPTTTEIACEFGFASANAAHCHLKALEKKGAVLWRKPGASRGYIVADTTCGVRP